MKVNDFVRRIPAGYSSNWCSFMTKNNLENNAIVRITKTSDSDRYIQFFSDQTCSWNPKLFILVDSKFEEYRQRLRSQ